MSDLTLRFDAFERQCESAALIVEDRMLRRVSSPIIRWVETDVGLSPVTESDLADETSWPFICRALREAFRA